MASPHVGSNVQLIVENCTPNKLSGSPTNALCRPDYGIAIGGLQDALKSTEAIASTVSSKRWLSRYLPLLRIVSNVSSFLAWNRVIVDSSLDQSGWSRLFFVFFLDIRWSEIEYGLHEVTEAKATSPREGRFRRPIRPAGGPRTENPGSRAGGVNRPRWSNYSVTQ